MCTCVCIWKGLRCTKPERLKRRYGRERFVTKVDFKDVVKLFRAMFGKKSKIH